MDDIVILGGQNCNRTFRREPCRHPTIALGATVAKSAMERAGVAPDQVGTVTYGYDQPEPRDMYLSRAAAIEAGIPTRLPL